MKANRVSLSHVRTFLADLIRAQFPKCNKRALVNAVSESEYPKRYLSLNSNEVGAMLKSYISPLMRRNDGIFVKNGVYAPTLDLNKMNSEGNVVNLLS